MSVKNLLEEKPYDLVLIDAMNLCARMHNAMRSLSYEGHPTGMLYGVMKKVIQLKKAHPKAEIRFLWEGGVSKRKDLHDHYKANRKRKDDTFHSCVTEVRKLLPATGCSEAYHFGLEADDMAGYMSDTLHDVMQILMISNDEDWVQFVKPSVHLQRGNGGIETYEDLSDSLGFKPEKMGMWKILRGDKSDGIKGIKSIPSAVIRLLLNRCDTLDEIREYNLSAHNPSWKRWEDAIRDNWDLLEINAELILYHQDWIEIESIVVNEAQKEDRDLLMEVFEKYNMKSLISEIEQWKV